MTDNKVELLKLILENDNVEQSVLTVADIISYFSKQHESDQEQAVADLPITHQTNVGT